MTALSHYCVYSTYNVNMGCSSEIATLHTALRTCFGVNNVAILCYVKGHLKKTRPSHFAYKISNEKMF